MDIKKSLCNRFDGNSGVITIGDITDRYLTSVGPILAGILLVGNYMFLSDFIPAVHNSLFLHCLYFYSIMSLVVSAHITIVFGYLLCLCIVRTIQYIKQIEVVKCNNK